jgi:protein RecA
VYDCQFSTNAQKGLVFFIDVEKTLDVAYAKLLGCDLSRLIIVNADSGEQAIDVLNDVLGAGVDVFVAVDSIAALVPTAELEASMDQQFQGLQPRLINRMMRVANSKMKRNLYTRNAPSTTIVAANQLREKIGVVYGNPETTPGGKGKDFTYSVRLKLMSTPGDKLMNKVKINGIERNIQYGQNIRYNISKNKCGGNQHEEGEFQYYKKLFKHYPRFSFNNDDFLLRYGLFFNLVEEVPRKGNKDATDFVYGDIRAGASHTFIEKLAADEDARQELLEEIMEKVIKENSGEDPDIEFVEEDSEVEVVPKKKKLAFKKK